MNDQAIAATRHLARQLAAYREELLKLGFSHEETRDMVLDMQGMLVSSALDRNK